MGAVCFAASACFGVRVVVSSAEIPTVAVVNEAVVVVIDAVAACLAGVGPYAVTEVLVVQVDTRVDDGDGEA